MNTLHCGLNEYIKKRDQRIGRVGEFLSTTIRPFLVNSNAPGFHLEIGCGHGHWLSSFARLKPDDIFIGIDLLSKRIRKSDLKKNNQKLDNLFFLKAEANEFLEAIPKDLNILSTFIMFPDPWPKKRHFKKRLMQNEFLQALSNVSSPNSNLFFRTDHQGYFNWTTNLIEKNASWQKSPEKWPHESSSFFQDLFESSYTLVAGKA